MKTWIIPMKGKGHEVTARNIALGDPMELARPLTTDEMDNVLMYEEQEAYADNGEGRQDEIRGGQYELDAYNQQVLKDGISYAITTRTFGDNNHFLLEIDERDTDTAGDEEGVRGSAYGGGIRCELYDEQDQEREIPEGALPDAHRRGTGDILL